SSYLSTAPPSVQSSPQCSTDCIPDRPGSSSVSRHPGVLFSLGPSSRGAVTVSGIFSVLRMARLP
ncbi:hypothetical protein NDU88_005283, partial [Pleurodeles waltl]